MVKGGSKKKQSVTIRVKQPVRMKRKAGKRRAPQSTPAFGPVSTIDTAPVSIGNTINGSTPIIIPIEDGQRIQGRDFLIPVASTGASIVDWTLVAACPVAPACMVASTLKHFSSTYAHYQVHGIAFHYITSATTASAGSVMFYINKDRAGPALSSSAANFMPAVLSDHNTLIGPLWQNCTASYFPEANWYATDVLNNEPLLGQCPGEVFVYTKTASTDVPGYILVDYDISFRGLSLNPKASILPITRMKYTQVRMSATAIATTVNSTPVDLAINSGLLLDGVTTSIAPSGILPGDVYKVVFNLDDATLSTFTTITLLTRELSASVFVVETITDGFTCYAMALSPTQVRLFPTYAAATTHGLQSAYLYGATSGSVTWSMIAFFSMCGSSGGAITQSSV